MTRRNRKILRRYGKKSFALIAEEMGLTRNMVAGVIWRWRWLYSERCGDGRNPGQHKCGTGHNGPGLFPQRTVTSEARS